MKAAVLLLAGHGLCVEAGAVHNATAAHSEHTVAFKSVKNHAEKALEHAVAGNVAKIVPPLVDVDTDKKFFGPPFPADYPDDISPPQKKKLFGKRAMYPKVQEEGFFDKDYVKDENNDGGLYDAQMAYDNARTKIFREKKQTENAAKRAAAEGRDVANAAKDVAKAKADEAAAAAAAAAAEEEARKAAANAKDEAARKAAERRKAAEAKAKAEQEADEARRAAEKEAMGKKVKEAEDALEKEKSSYQECLKELQAAKAHAEKLEKERDELRAEGSKATKLVVKDSSDLKAEKAAVAAAQKRTAEAEAKQKAAAQRVIEASAATAEAKRKLEEEKAENAAAMKKIENEDKELKKAEKELAESKTHLRQIRGIDAVPGKESPAPEPVPQKSSATAFKASMTLIAVAYAASAFA